MGGQGNFPVQSVSHAGEFKGPLLGFVFEDEATPENDVCLPAHGLPYYGLLQGECAIVDVAPAGVVRASNLAAVTAKEPKTS